MGDGMLGGRDGGRCRVYILLPEMMTSVWICYGELYSQLYSVCLVETKYLETKSATLQTLNEDGFL
jgi:hypothetical protein